MTLETACTAFGESTLPFRSPVILVMQELVVMVQKHGWLIHYLLEVLLRGAREEAAIRCMDAPRQRDMEGVWPGGLEGVQLAVKGVERGIQARSDEPIAIQVGDIEGRHEHRVWRGGEAAVVWLLRHAARSRDSAVVELVYH